MEAGGTGAEPAFPLTPAADPKAMTGWPVLARGPIRFFEGRPDLQDASRFDLQYEVDGMRKTVAVRLIDANPGAPVTGIFANYGSGVGATLEFQGDPHGANKPAP